MQRYQDSVLTQNANGVTVVGSGLTVMVYNAGTIVPATIFSDNGITAIPQLTTPILTDINGKFQFYAANGRYDITITGAAITSVTIPDILLEDLAQFFGGNYADNTGTVNALVASYPNAVTSILNDGYRVLVDTAALVLGSNTAAVTFTPTLRGVLQATTSVLKYNGMRALVPLVAGDLPPIAQLRYNITVAQWVLVNPTPGESVTATAALSSVALATGAATTITSIVLSVGDWDISGVVVYTPATTTSVTNYAECSSTVAATFDAIGTYAQDPQAAFVPGGAQSSRLTPIRRLVVTAPTTVYLVAQAIFTVSTMAAGGVLTARRVAQ